MKKTHVLFAFARPLTQMFFTDEALADIDDISVVEKRENITDTDTLDSVLDRFPADIIVTGWGSAALTEDLMRKHPQLKYVCHCGGEIKAYIPKQLIEHGLIATNWGKLPSRMLGEAALMGILSCLRRTTEAHMIMHTKRSWKQTTDAGTETLFGQRVGIFGFGASGRELVKLLKPFSCEVSAYSPFESDDVFEALDVRRMQTLDALFRHNRIISVHASLTKENYHVIDRKMLDLLQPDAVIVNTARGAIFDETALIEVLRTGALRASLDVYEHEPLPEDSPLRGLPNVQLIPHQASPTSDQYKEIGNIVADNIAKIVSGRMPENIVDEPMYDYIT